MKSLTLFFILLAGGLCAQERETTMKAWGDKATQTIITVPTYTDDGTPNIATMMPLPILVPLVKVPQPTDGKFYKPNIVWFADRVERQWVERTQTQAEIKAAADKTECQAVRSMIAKLQAGTATAAEQRRCLIYLLRQLQ
jgi:hypothetical protein